MKILKTVFNLIAEILIFTVSIWLLTVHIEATTSPVGTVVSAVIILPFLLTCLGSGLAYAITFIIISTIKRNPPLIVIHLMLSIAYILGIITTFAVL